MNENQLINEYSKKKKEENIPIKASGIYKLKKEREGRRYLNFEYWKWSIGRTLKKF